MILTCHCGNLWIVWEPFSSQYEKTWYTRSKLKNIVLLLYSIYSYHILIMSVEWASWDSIAPILLVVWESTYLANKTQQKLRTQKIKLKQHYKAVNIPTLKPCWINLQGATSQKPSTTNFSMTGNSAVLPHASKSRLQHLNQKVRYKTRMERFIPVWAKHTFQMCPLQFCVPTGLHIHLLQLQIHCSTENSTANGCKFHC